MKSYSPKPVTYFLVLAHGAMGADLSTSDNIGRKEGNIPLHLLNLDISPGLHLWKNFLHY